VIVAIPASTKSNLAELSSNDIDQSHTLHGWLLLPKRKMSKRFQFLKLRDSNGNVLQLRTSIALDPDLTSESPAAVTGIVRLRPESHRRGGLEDYEFEVSHIHHLNGVKVTLPFQPDDALSVKASTRAEYRYLDLRNRSNRNFLELRYRVEKTCRAILDKMGFLQVETPLLFKSTPEGAREFIVPTRQAGQGYALPQSPQQYKQILMASGISRYFQFAKCFRDEDLRAERQPEFTQVRSPEKVPSNNSWIWKWRLREVKM
jgi:aspartyl-tRNA synthetase